MAKRYVFNVIYKNKVIDKIDVVVNLESCAFLEGGDDKDFATEEASAMALDVLNIELDEIISED